ncbi:MAG: collagen-like protein [Cyanobacteria bacterium J06621_11]
MTDSLPTARITVKRSALSDPPESLSFGELAWADGGDGQLFIGRLDGEVKPIPGGSQSGTPGPVGPRGEPGPAGPVGEAGAQGAPGDSIIHVGNEPPTDASKILWFKLDASGAIIERWQRGGVDLWLSQQAYTISEFEFEVKRNRSWPQPNPCRGYQLWVESLTARAWVQDNMRDGDYVDFQLKRVNTQQQKILEWYLRLEGASKGDVFEASEAVGQVFNSNDAIALWLQIQRNGQTKLKTASITAIVREVYAST